MRQVILSILFCCTFLSSIKSQDSLKPITTVHLPAYKAEFKLMQGETFKGYLMAIKDSSAYTYEKKGSGPDPLHKSGTNKYDETVWSRYSYQDIAGIKIINQKARTWLVLSGLIVGLTAGIIVGNSVSKGGTGVNGAANSAAGVFLGGLVGAGVGVVTGAIIAGSFDRKYLINGEWKNLEELKTTLNK